MARDFEFAQAIGGGNTAASISTQSGNGRQAIRTLTFVQSIKALRRVMVPACVWFL